jgi:hypothetical protein
MTVVETEVVSIVRQLDPISKEPIYSVSFAHVVPIDDEIYKNLFEPDKERIGNELYTEGIVLNIKIDGKRRIPYAVGSKWNINVDENGSVHLTEVK